MDGKGFVSDQVLTASLLILSALLFLPAGVLYTGRAIWKWWVHYVAPLVIGIALLLKR